MRPPISTLAATATTDYEQPGLAREEQAQVAEAGEGEAAVAAGKAPPAVVEDVVAGLGADVEADEHVLGGAGRGLAARDEVRAGTADGVLDGVGEEGGQHEGDEEAEEGDVVLVDAGARKQIQREHERERDSPGVEDIPGDGDALDLGMGEGDGEVVNEEEAVERYGEEGDEGVGDEEEEEAQIVWRIGTLQAHNYMVSKSVESDQRQEHSKEPSSQQRSAADALHSPPGRMRNTVIKADGYAPSRI